MKTEKRIAYAALDIGTSQLKLGVYCPFLSNRITLINNFQNELTYGSSGAVCAEYGLIHEKSFALLKELGSFLRSNNVTTLYLGICGHISSLVEWNRIRGTAPAQPFPIWLDTTCYSSLDEYQELMGEGRSKEIIGTFLPAGTNWLLTKLLQRRKSGFPADAMFLQAGDAVFYELCGQYTTHFSSQLSLVDLRKREYAPRLLNHLALPAASLPTIDEAPCKILEPVKALFDFPGECFVFPAMADLYSSLSGLRLEDKQGFVLANTSEQAGAFYRQRPTMLSNFLGISFDPGFINYGSTNTGGNTVNWFVSTVLGKALTPTILDELTLAAAAIEPKDTPVFLPYLQGERAPLWNSRLTASFLELNAAHSTAHLFRAILESIAFARRQCFEELGIIDLDIIKLAGGSAKNHSWNLIRATVLNKTMGVADEKELAIAGTIDHMMNSIHDGQEKPVLNFVKTEPDPTLVDAYDEKYVRFIRYQKMLS